MATYYDKQELKQNETQEYTVDLQDLEDGSKSLTFRWNNILHRTDGPAHIIWYTNGSIYEFYAVRGARIEKDQFMEFFNAPTEELPLLINHMYLGEVIKDKLAGNTTTIKTYSTFLIENTKLNTLP